MKSCVSNPELVKVCWMLNFNFLYPKVVNEIKYLKMTQTFADMRKRTEKNALPPLNSPIGREANEEYKTD